MFLLAWFGILGYGSYDATAIVKAYYIGYSVSPAGSLVGAIHGFLDAGVSCALLALAYNKLTKK